MISSRRSTVDDAIYLPHFFDFRFLNPFQIDIEGNMIGVRYFAAQFVLLFSFISMIILAYSTMSIYSVTPVVTSILITGFLIYYGVSCILIPNNHERCYFMPWLFTIFPIMAAGIGCIIAVFVYLSTSVSTSTTVGGKKNNKKNNKKIKI